MSGRARGLALLAAALVLSGCAGGADPGAGPDASTSATTGDPFDLGVGDCVDATTGSGEVTEVPIVPCSAAHVGEAYAAVRMPGSGQFPGDEAVVESARGCEAPFEEFVGMPLAGSQLKVTYFRPTPESWKAGDREILCIVSDPTGPVVGTLRGASR